MARYQAILFDADNTLLDYDKTEAYALRTSFAALGLEYQQESVLGQYRELNKALWEEFERGEVSAAELRTERFRRLLEEIGAHISETDLSDLYLRKLEETGFLTPGADEVLSALDRRVRMALVTNGFSSVQRSRLAQSGIENYFEHIIISEEVGCRKPKVEIFDLAMRLLFPVDREKTLFVGDSLTSDIKGGNEAGIDTCWYNPQCEKNGTEIRPKYEVRKLEDVVDLALGSE